MIKVTGTVTLQVPYEVFFNITEEEFDSLSERGQDELIESSIDWHNAVRNARTSEIEVDNVDSI